MRVEGIHNVGLYLQKIYPQRFSVDWKGCYSPKNVKSRFSLFFSRRKINK